MKWLFDKLGVYDKASLKALIWQFIKFGLVGISNTIVSMSVYYLFLWINDDLYMLGSILGTIISIANAFLWNELFVFNGNNKDLMSIIRRLGKTYISYGGTSLLSTVLLWVEVNMFYVSRAYAPIVNLLLTIPLNYLINKFWTFRR